MTIDDPIEIPPEAQNAGGSAPPQSAVTSQITVVREGIPAGAIEQFKMTAAFQSLVAIGIRGPSAMSLAIALSSIREADLSAEKEEKRKLREESSSWEKKYYDVREKLATLQRETMILHSMNRPQSIIRTLGGILLGAGITSAFKQIDGLALGLTIVGAIMLLVRWPKPSRQSEEDHQ